MTVAVRYGLVASEGYFSTTSVVIDQPRLGVCEIDAKPAVVSEAFGRLAERYEAEAKRENERVGERN